MIPNPGTAAPAAAFTPRIDRLTIFCLVWAVAECFHILSFITPDRLPIAIPRLVTLLAFLLRPSDLRRFALMLAGDATYILAISPMTANHIFFLALADITMLILILDAMRKPRPLDRSLLYRNLQSLLRVELILLYVFAVLHKLNTDYFDPRVSCAGQLLLEMKERFPFLPTSDQAVWFSMLGTMAVEAAIPVLLVFRRTRLAAIALGLGFHYFLSVHQHIGLYSFSALMFALFLASAPADFGERVLARCAEWQWIRRLADRLQVSSAFAGFAILVAGAIILAGITGAVFALNVPGVHDANTAAHTVGQLLWAPYGMLLVILFVIGASSIRPPVAGDSLVVRAPSLAWLMPVVIFAHSMCPYFGLKTVPCLAMFSNLRTEGTVGNHLFIPASWKVFGYQDDLVQVVRSSDPWLTNVARDRLVIPYFELCRRINSIKKPLSVMYVRGGEAFELVDARPSERPGIAETPWLLGKFLRFRPVNPSGPNGCRW